MILGSGRIVQELFTVPFHENGTYLFQIGILDFSHLAHDIIVHLGAFFRGGAYEFRHIEFVLLRGLAEFRHPQLMSPLPLRHRRAHLYDGVFAIALKLRDFTLGGVPFLGAHVPRPVAQNHVDIFFLIGTHADSHRLHQEKIIEFAARLQAPGIYFFHPYHSLEYFTIFLYLQQPAFSPHLLSAPSARASGKKDSPRREVQREARQENPLGN